MSPPLPLHVGLGCTPPPPCHHVELGCTPLPPRRVGLGLRLVVLGWVAPLCWAALALVVRHVFIDFCPARRWVVGVFDRVCAVCRGHCWGLSHRHLDSGCVAGHYRRVVRDIIEGWVVVIGPYPRFPHYC